MADNKEKKHQTEIFYDLDSWLRDAIGQNALAHDNLNTIRELGFKQEAEQGKAIHSLEKGLREVAAWASSHYGLYPEFRRLPGNKGTKIVFRPRGADAKNIQDADCPFIEISQTGQNGSYVVRDGILSPNSPILVRGANGEIGLASVMSTEIAQILDDWKDNDAKIRQQINRSRVEGLRYMKRMTSRSTSSVKQLTAGVYSTHQIKDYQELNDKSVNNLRPEALWAMMSQVLTGHYQRSLYNANKEKSGAPTVEQFTRDIENIMNASRGFKTPQQVSNYVKQNYGWIYKNVWKGDFENVFKSFAGKMYQSGMTEGTVGKFGLMEVEAALQALQAPGKKLKQNAQVLPQKTSYLHGKARAATGMTAVMSKNQLAQIRQGIKNGFMSRNDIFKDVYSTAFLSKADLEKGRKELARLYSGRYDKENSTEKEIREKYGLSVKQFEKQYEKSREMWLKGFGADASFMGEDLAREFRNIRDPKHLKDGFVQFDEVNTYIRESILKSKQAKLERLKGKEGKGVAAKIEKLNQEIEKFSQEDLNVLEKEASGKYVYKNEGVWDAFQRYVRKAYGLDDTYTINNNYKGGKGEAITNLIGTRARHNSTAVFRAGLTADERTTKSVGTNLQMASAMLAAGYSPEEIFRDAANKLGQGGGLKAQNFIENAPISNKNIRSRIMQVLTHVTSELRDTRGMAGAEIAQYFKDDPFFGKFFKNGGKNAIFSIDKETGMLLVDNNALQTRLEEKKKTDAEFATNMLFAAVNVGKAAGVYDADKTYFSKRRANGKSWIVTENPLMVKEELGLSSSPEWMNLGRGGNTRSKIGINEMRSLESTLGAFSDYLLENNYTSGNEDKAKDYDKAIAPLRNFTNSVRDKMEDRKREYQKYVDNAGFLEQAFAKDAEQAEQLQKDFQNNKTIVKLTKEDLNQMNLDLDYDSLDKGGMVIKDGDIETSNLVGPYLRRKRQQYFNKIQALKKNKKQWKKLSESEKAQYEAINSEEDLKTFALDLGDETLTTNIKGQDYYTKMFALPLGFYDEDNKSIYKPDEGLKYATRMLRSAKDYLLPEQGVAFDRQQQAYYSVLNMIDELQGYGKEITSGNTFERYHQITGGQGSGYLLLQGMTDSSEEVLKDLLGKPNFEGLKNVSRIISTTDLTSMLKAEISENRENVEGLYKSLFGKGIGKNSDASVIKAIVNSVDISRKNKKGNRTWKGTVLNNAWSNRNPTINFINDLIGGGLVATSNEDLVAQGRMMINQHYAAIGKGDMDGDLVTLFDALNAGDFQTAGAALNAYFTDEREYQRKIQEEEKKEDEKNLEAIKRNIKKNDPQYDTSRITAAGEIPKANTVLNKDEKDITVAAAWLGKQGAGRYGNAKFTAEDIIAETIGTEGRQGKNITALGGRVFGAIIQSLYQKGINIKNLKRGTDDEASRVYGQMLSTMDMATAAGTWDDPRIMRAFLNQATDLGVFKKEAMFEGATLQTLGLDKITKKDKELLSQLKHLAEDTKKRLTTQFGEGSPEVKQIEKDIKEINAVQKGKQDFLKNLSNEMVQAILGDYTGSFAHAVGKHGESLGVKMGQMWERIPGYASSRDNMIPRLGGVYGSYGKRGDSYLSEVAKINKGGIIGHTSPSSELKKTVGSVKESIQADTVLEKLAYRYIHATSDKERASIRQEANKYTSSFMDKQGAEDKIRGLISHKVAEILEPNKGIDLSGWNNGDEGYNLLKNDAGTSEFLGNLERQLKFLNPDRYENEEELKEFVRKAAHKGVTNTRILRSRMGKNAVSLGGEIPLAGYTQVEDNGNYKLSHQIADAMWVEEGEDGLLTLHIADYKNPKSGHTSLQNALQIKDYERSMVLLQNQLKELRTQGKTINNEDAFFAVKNAYTKNWESILESAAAKDAGASSGREYEEALAARRKNFGTLLKYANQGFSRRVGHIFAAGDNGYTNEYQFNLRSEKLQDLFENEYLKNHKTVDDFTGYNSEKANIIMNEATTHMGTYYTGTATDAAKGHSKELEELKKRYAEFAVAQRALNELELKWAALGRDIETPESRLKADKLKGEIEAQKTALDQQKQEFDAELQKLGGTSAYSDQGLRLTKMTADGKELGVGDLLVDEMNTYMTVVDKFTDEEKEKARQKVLFKGLVEHSADYEKQSQKVAELEAAMKSPLLKGKHRSALKKQTKRQLEEEKEALAILRDSIDLERKGLIVNEEGKIINPFDQTVVDEELYGIGKNLDKLDKENRKKAKQERGIADRRQVASYESAVLDYEAKRYSFEDQIAEKTEERTKAEEEGEEDRVRRLDLEIERLERIKELTLEMSKLDLDNMGGANKSSEKNMKELAALLHEEEKAKKELSKKQPQGNGGNGGGFLGIDSATSRWLSRIINGGAVYTFIRMVRTGLRDIVNKAKQLDQAMTNLRIVTGKSASDARTLINNYAELGKELGATTVEITTAATAWLRQGYDISQVNDLVTASLYLSKLGMIDTATATMNLTSAMHGFKLEASEAMDVVDKLTALDVKAATTAGDIAQGLSQFANIASLNGVNIDQAAAYVATIADVNQMSGTSVGQSLNFYGDLRG